MMNLFLVKWCLQQGSENNLCGYYVCELLMEYSRRTPEEILEVRKKYTQFICYHCVNIYKATYLVQTERIKMPKRGVNWAFLNFIARIKTY
jgi:hypothetical protein